MFFRPTKYQPNDILVCLWNVVNSIGELHCSTGHESRPCTIGSSFELTNLRAELVEWERIYDTVRPHQALGYITPLQFLERWQQKRREEVGCH